MVTGIDGLVSKLLFNAEELVVLGKPLRATGSSRLDLPRAKTNNEIGNERVFGFSGAVRDHDSPLVRKGQVGSVVCMY